jgi:hypothetical protein
MHIPQHNFFGGETFGTFCTFVCMLSVTLCHLTSAFLLNQTYVANYIYTVVTYTDRLLTLQVPTLVAIARCLGSSKESV